MIKLTLEAAASHDHACRGRGGSRHACVRVVIQHQFRDTAHLAASRQPHVCALASICTTQTAHTHVTRACHTSTNRHTRHRPSRCASIVRHHAGHQPLQSAAPSSAKHPASRQVCMARQRVLGRTPPGSPGVRYNSSGGASEERRVPHAVVGVVLRVCCSVVQCGALWSAEAAAAMQSSARPCQRVRPHASLGSAGHANL
jgi:hypothetical protein